MGRGGSHAPGKIIDAIQRNDTGFSSRISDRTTNRLDISSTYPPNTERHKFTVNGTEDREFTTQFTNQPGTYQLTASDGDTVSLSSREQFRYVPNYEALFGIAAWYETDATTLSNGQRLFVELSDDERNNAFGYEFTPGDTRAFIRSGGTLIDELPQSEFGAYTNGKAEKGDPFDHIDRDQPLNPRGYLNWYGVGQFRPTLSYTQSDSQQSNETLGYLSNQDDVTTEEINLKPRVVLDADAGAASYTVNVGSMGTLIRGGATEFDRPRAAVFYDLGGSIGATYAGNDPLLAKRHAPDKQNVSVKLDIPEFSPSGDVTVDILVGAVSPSETDATGFAPSRQGDAQNTAVEYTTNVSTFPTVTRDVPDSSTQVEVPDVRYLASSVAEGAKNDPSKAEAGPGEQNKRILGEDEIALYIPRTAGSTSVSLNWLRPVNTQDW